MDNSKIKKYIVIIAVFVFITAASIIYFRYKPFTRERLVISEEEIIIEPAERTAPPEPSASPSPTPAPTPSESQSPTPSPTPTPTPTPAPTVQPYFVDLIEEYGNEDIVGYMKIDGTSVDDIVVQCDDNEFYLDHNIYKKSDHAGWIFLDYENDVALEDYNTILYGHNMKTDTKFHSIRYYRNYDYFDKHRIITFNTLYGDYEWEIFSFYKTDISFGYTQVYFPNKQNYYELIKKFKEKSIYDTGIDIGEDDRVLTISTCTNESENTRFVLHAKLIR